MTHAPIGPKGRLKSVFALSSQDREKGVNSTILGYGQAVPQVHFQVTKGLVCFTQQTERS